METQGIPEAATVICALLLVGAMLLAGVRIVRGPHVADRVVALDMLSLLGVAAAALAAVVSDAMVFVDVALGVALVGFSLPLPLPHSSTCGWTARRIDHDAVAEFVVPGRRRGTLPACRLGGVLRLPDFFMRMHAATKAGVVGCGLVLIGAGLADGTAGTWVKVGVALAFLLLTTPVAGHLLGRAAYVGGAPLWQGTTSDDLRTVLPRGQVREPAFARCGTPTPGAWAVTASSWRSRRVRTWRPPSGRPSRWARERGTELCGLAIIDVPRLCNVGPVPIGAGWHAQQMRERRTVWHARRRQTSSSASRRWPAHRACAGRFAWRRDGRRRSWRKVAQPGCVLAVAPGGWFDQGVLDLEVDVRRRLRWSGLRRDIVVLGARPDKVAG